MPKPGCARWGVALIYSLFNSCFKVSLRQQELGIPQHFEHEELVMFNRAAVDKTRNMEHSGTFRNIPEHEKIFKILKK